MRSPGYPRLTLVIILIVTASLFGRSAKSNDPASPAKAFHLDVLEGYLARSQLPDSLALVPPPPAPGSAAYALDKAAARKSTELHGTSRWKLATRDADLSFPAAAGAFSCAIEAPITEARTPVTYRLLRRSLTDAGLATYATKDKYNRTRPFVSNGAPICTPALRSALAKDGSYPSGHSAVGWAWALILTEIVPDRADAILARGRAFGESRMVCNVHWLSDVEEGRIVGASTVARLHADPAFLGDVAQARKEIASVRAQGSPPDRNCAEENLAMAQHRGLDR